MPVVAQAKVSRWHQGFLMQPTPGQHDLDAPAAQFLDDGDIGIGDQHVQLLDADRHLFGVALRVRRFMIHDQDRLLYGGDIATPASGAISSGPIYQHRLLYGSDFALASAQSGKVLACDAAKVRRQHWRYFNTEESFKVSDLDRPIPDALAAKP